MNPVLDAIYKRRSVRDFTADLIERDTLIEIIKAGTWAPSGLNNQPWRFAIVTEKDLKAKFGELTRYEKVIKGAKALIPVFVDRDAMYHELKDHQAIGACLQNMLLAAYALGLGSVWLGEILKNSDRVRDLLGLSKNLELMAVLALGHPAHKNQISTRQSFKEMIVFET
ncbi:MAG TPA: nitroreductase family protein [Deltaproteobacteria bacterium]|nr:MAG: nitroreductase family protein [Thermodesulfobacteriota bacterium]HDH97698.1 nitroreductase family protein [Deltaproteobacteria bacterium]